MNALSPGEDRYRIVCDYAERGTGIAVLRHVAERLAGLARSVPG